MAALTMSLPPRNPGNEPGHGWLLPEKPDSPSQRLGLPGERNNPWLPLNPLKEVIELFKFRDCWYFQFLLSPQSKIIPLLVCSQGLGLPQKQNHDQLFPKGLNGNDFQMLV